MRNECLVLRLDKSKSVNKNYPKLENTVNMACLYHVLLQRS